MTKKNTPPLETLFNMIESKKRYAMDLDAINKMLISRDTPLFIDNKLRRCREITFIGDGNIKTVTVNHDDEELLVRILNEVKTYYAERLKGIDMLIGFAERAVSKECGTDLLQLLEANIQALKNESQTKTEVISDAKQ